MTAPVPTPATIHASAVLLDGTAVLIRGPSGSGKSRLALELLTLKACWAETRLIGDDRIRLANVGGRLIAHPAPGLEGLIEVRGLGLRKMDYEPEGQVGLVVDLAAADALRLPPPDLAAVLDGVTLPRLAIPAGAAALPCLLGWGGTRPAAF